MLAFAAAATALAAGAPSPPPILHEPIPYGAARRRDMAAYSQRHYGRREWRLRHPRVIVEHVAVAASVAAVRATFAPNRPDIELGELPGVCAHFVVGPRGDVHQLVPTSIRCRHTVGLNHTAIGIEHVGFRDSDVMGDRRVLRASLRLTRWLSCRYAIRVRDVIGHNESLRSPYHRERVRRLRRQTHGDMRRSTMRRYRRALSRTGSCPRPPSGSPAAR